MHCGRFLSARHHFKNTVEPNHEFLRRCLLLNLENAKLKIIPIERKGLDHRKQSDRALKVTKLQQHMNQASLSFRNIRV